MRRLYALAWLSVELAGAQTIFTVAGLPYSHRDAVDGKPARNAPLGYVYGLLFDKLTGRLLLHDEGLVFRYEPDGSLLSLVGIGRGAREGANTDGTLASALNVGAFRGMVQDATGALYISDAALGRVYHIGLDGVVTTFAGGGSAYPESASDGGRATDAALPSPRGLVFDSHGNLDIVEAYCFCIRRVNPSGIISTVFKLPQEPGFFQYFEGLAIDSKDNLYATEYRGSAVWKITADGAANVIAGTGVAGFGGDGGPAIAAQLNGPSGVTLDSAGNLYITDTFNYRVRRITPDGTISTFAGTGDRGFAGDGGLATAAQFVLPAQTLIDSSDNVYISDYGNRRVRVVSKSGIISTVAGNGLNDPPVQTAPQTGDGGPALNATLHMANSAAFSPAGDLYVADAMDNRIRKIARDGTISTFAGVGGPGFTGFFGEGGLATQAGVPSPITVAVDKSGIVYFETGDSRVLKVTLDGIIHLVAGTGTGTGLVRSGGDGGPAVNATLNEPKGLAIDAQGNVYIGDTSNARLRKVDTNGIITTVAGPGIQGADYWNAVAFDPQGNLYVAITHTGVLDQKFFSVIDRVNADGSMTPVAGNSANCANQTGPPVFPSDGVQASQAKLCVIVGLTFDPQGNMYIPEAFYGAVLKVTPDGAIRRIAGSSTSNQLGDGGSPLLASLTGVSYSPSSVAIDAAGNLFIPQSTRIREVVPGAIAVQLSKDRIDFQSPATQSQSVQVTTTVAQPLPFSVQIKTTGAWLTANRVTGQTNDLVTFSANPAGLATGVYTATVQLTVPGTTATPAVLPVTLTVK